MACMWFTVSPPQPRPWYLMETRIEVGEHDNGWHTIGRNRFRGKEWWRHELHSHGDYYLANNRHLLIAMPFLGSINCPGLPLRCIIFCDSIASLWLAMFAELCESECSGITIAEVHDLAAMNTVILSCQKSPIFDVSFGRYSCDMFADGLFVFSLFSLRRFIIQSIEAGWKQQYVLSVLFSWWKTIMFKCPGKLLFTDQ